MKCALCNNEIIKKRGPVEFHTRSLGTISVPGLEFMECTACNEKLLTPEQSDEAIEYIANKEQELISALPIGEFITANEAGDLLGVTKQAFSKNPKIKAGLTYSVKIGNRNFYHRRSVELFKAQGNGKFLLTPPQDSIGITEIDDWVGTESGNIFEKENLMTNIYQIGDVVLYRGTPGRFYTNATSYFHSKIIEKEEIKAEPLTTGDIE